MEMTLAVRKITLIYEMNSKTSFISVATERDPKCKITDESKNLNLCWQ